ncbi:hypothetical protein TrST_g7047 [Triparma strigata]|uniref:EF-hand domain-containing protein n=1 Tax=Triparma strigata TaxID=1606541 RepID=A0A9W7F0G3_9STRA|nr:hypothetical protein TrST_g7047 [Triparma strigata]
MPKTAFDLYETSSPDVISVKPRSKSSRPSEIVASEKSNFITRSKWVRKRMERVFDSLDVSGDGRLDSTELYSGVLLIQLELAKYFGPAACKPPSRQQVDEMFWTFDSDSSGDLDKNEFCNLLQILLSNIAGRVLFQFAMTIALVPFLAPKIVYYATLGVQKFHALNPQNISTTIATFYTTHIVENPTISPYYSQLLSKIPATLPNTIAGVILVTLFVPSVLDFIDNMSMSAARKTTKAKSS